MTEAGQNSGEHLPQRRSNPIRFKSNNNGYRDYLMENARVRFLCTSIRKRTSGRSEYTSTSAYKPYKHFPLCNLFIS